MADLLTREPLSVLEHTVADSPGEIGVAWPWFENLVGLKGRRMFARIDERAGTYTVCTPVRPGDSYDLTIGEIPGGRYRRTRLKGEPDELYPRIGPAMEELKAAGPYDETRPLIEYYRRRDEVELWVPVS